MPKEVFASLGKVRFFYTWHAFCISTRNMCRAVRTKRTLCAAHPREHKVRGGMRTPERSVFTVETSTAGMSRGKEGVRKMAVNITAEL